MKVLQFLVFAGLAVEAGIHWYHTLIPFSDMNLLWCAALMYFGDQVVKCLDGGTPQPSEHQRDIRSDD